MGVGAGNWRALFIHEPVVRRATTSSSIGVSLFSSLLPSLSEVLVLMFVQHPVLFQVLLFAAALTLPTRRSVFPAALSVVLGSLTS